MCPRQNGAIEVFVDDARVYWVEISGTVCSCLKDQCATTKVTYPTSSGGYGPGLYVAIDGVNLYWYRMGASNDGVATSTAPPSAVFSCPRSGCGQGPQTVIENVDPISLASDGTFLYWSSVGQTSVFRCAIDNCSATQTALAQTQTGAQDLAVSGGYVYWIVADSLSSNAVRRVATDGTSSVEDVTTGQNQAASLMVHEPYVYFTDSIAVGEVLRCPVTGCPSGPTVVASGLAFPDSVVADDTNAYWVNLGNNMTIVPDGSFAKCAVGGCGSNTTTLASSQIFGSAFGDHMVAIDDQYVYWVSQGAEQGFAFPDAAIHRLAK